MWPNWQFSADLVTFNEEFFSGKRHFFCAVTNYPRDGSKWNYKLTQYLWKKGGVQVLVSKKSSNFEYTRSLHVASWNNGGTTQMYGCKCSFEIHCINTVHGSKCSCKKYRFRWWMDGGNYFREIKKNCLWKRLFPAIKHSNK